MAADDLVIRGARASAAMAHAIEPILQENYVGLIYMQLHNSCATAFTDTLIYGHSYGNIH